MVSSSRPFLASIATSHALIDDTWMGCSAAFRSMTRLTRCGNSRDADTHQTQTWVSSTIT